MSIFISGIARQIASKLDATDKNGTDRKIDSEKWNAFAAGKGNGIKRYIGVNTAAKSISVYLNRESAASGESVSDIGQRWLNQLDTSVREVSVELDGIVVTSDKQYKPKYVALPELKDEPTAELHPLQVTVPSAPVDRHVVSDACQQISIIPESFEASVLSSAGLNKETPANPYEPAVADNVISPEELEELSEHAENDASKEYIDHTIYCSTIQIVLNVLLVTYRLNKGVNITLMQQLSKVISQLDQTELTVANIIKTVKDEMYPELKSVFRNDIVATSEFLRLAAQTVSTQLYRDDKIASREDIVTTAQAYYEADIKSQTEGNVYFSNSRRRAWCADTVTTIVSQALGDSLPVDFGTASVSNLRAWGIKHDCYRETSVMAPKTRRLYIAQCVKPGDIMIEKRHKSHTGIVVEVAEDGSWFRTIEGNASKSVATRTYSSDSKTLSGFVSVEDFINEENSDN